MSLASHPASRPTTIDETRRTLGAHGVVDFAVAVLTSRRLRDDADIDEHLTALKSACRQTRRYREALPVLHRIATLHPRRRPEMTAEIALVHWHLGERERAVALLTSTVAQQRGLPPWKRDLAFAVVAEVAATVAGCRDLAAECAQLGRSSTMPNPRTARTTKFHATATHATATHATTGRATTTHATTGHGTTGHGTTGHATTGHGTTARTVPVPVPTVGRRRAKGPVRQLSVLSALGTANRVGTDASTPTRPRLSLVGGSAA